jgi:predicted aspartyl protease
MTPWALAVALSLATPALAGAGEEAGGADPPPDAVLGTLPFEDWHEPNRVVVDLAPDGHKPFRMIVDTGAQGSVMTPLMARSLGVSVRRHKSSPYRKATSLGRDLQFWVDTRSSDTGSKTGWEYGLLGGNFLEAYVVEIDFPGRRVRFLDRKKYRVPKQTAASDEAVVPLRITAGRPFAEVEVDGRPVRVLLDTGDPYTASLSGRAAAGLGIDADSLPEFFDAAFVLGPTKQLFYEAKSLAIGGFSRGPMPMTVLPHGSYNLGGTTDSAVGYDVLAPFVVRLDYPRKRMWLRKTGGDRVTFLGADWASSKRIGAILVPHRGGYYVVRVEAEGAASRYGIRAGDRVVAPAGEELPPLEEVARRVAAGEELTVARPQGDVWVDLVLPEPTSGETDADPAG